MLDFSEFRFIHFRAAFVLVFLLILISSQNLRAEESWWGTPDGSTSIWVSNRFFSTQPFKKMGAKDSDWAVIQFNAEFGLWKFPFGLEPLIGVSILKNSKTGSLVDTTGAAADRFEFFLLTTTSGLRYKPWGPSFFFIAPYAEALMSWTFSRSHFELGSTQYKQHYGSEFGYILGGGLIFSLFYDHQLRSEMEGVWEMKDFGIFSSARYLGGGISKSAALTYKNTKGWDFGLGLYLAY